MDTAKILSTYCALNKLKPTAEFSVQKQIFDTPLLSEEPLTLETVIEKLTPKTTKSVPFPLAFFIANELIMRAEQNEIDLTTARILDPEIGSGSLLYAFITLLHKKTKQPIDHILNRITGLSLNNLHIQNFTYILELMLLHKKIKTTESINLYTSDPFTYRHESTYDILLTTLPTSLRFPKKVQTHIAALTNTLLPTELSTPEPYLQYFSLAKTITSPYSVSSITLTPNDYTLENSPSAEALRKLLIEQELLDHVLKIKLPKKGKHEQYTTVSFLTNRLSPSPTDKARVHTIDSIEELETLPKNWGNSPDMQILLPGNLNNPWDASVDPAIRKALNIITTQPNFLTEHIQVYPSVDTGRDTLYTLPGKQDKNGHYIKRIKNQVFLIEEELTVPLIKLTPRSDETALNKTRTRVIYPYRKNENGKTLLIPEEELCSYFPNAYEYFKTVKPLLDKRPSQKKKETKENWYEYASPPPSLIDSFALVTALKFPAHSSPTLMNVNRVPSLIINGLALKIINEDTDIIQAVLNSSVFSRYLTYILKPNMKGEYQLTEEVFKEFTIPSFTDLQRKGIRITDGSDRDRIIVTAY